MGLLSTIGAASGRAFGFTRSAIAAATDAFFNRVTLLLHGDGTNGAQNNTFLDSSSNNFSITRNGNATQGTFSPFSQTGWSNYFVSSASSTIGFANNAAFQFGAPSSNTNDFCIEFFAYPTTTAISIPVGTGYTSSTTYWNFNFNRTTGGVNTAGYVQFYLTDNFNLTATSGLNANAYNHICVVRTGTTLSLFVNGTRQATGTSSIDPNPTGSLYVGGDAFNLARYIDGYVSNVRIIKGATQPYSASSTSITVPTTPLTAITGTTVLTCQSNRFIDNSSNALAITVTGTPSVQAFSPFAPTAAYSTSAVGGSGYFDGAGDYLQVAHNAALTVTGNVDASFEAWIYPTSVGANGVQILNKSGISGTSYPNFALYLNASRNLVFLGGNSGSPGSSQVTVTGATVIPLNAWTHVLATKRYVGGGSVNEYRVFLNGKLDGYATQANLSDARAGVFTIGFELSGSMPFVGNIAGVRVYNASIPSAYQTASTTTGTQIFTAPSAPATAGTESILLNFTNGAIFDQTGKNVLETVGNAQISTTVKKYGTGSLSFNGTTDYLKVTYIRPIWEFYTGDFTIEAWVNVNSVSTTYQTIAGVWLGANKYGWLVQMRSTDLLFAYGTAGSTAASVTFSWTPSASTWYHVAITRSGSSVKAFVNGTQIGTTQTISASIQSDNPLWIGANQDSGPQQYFNGYIDDLRITKYARYTANFTPPAAAFADQ